MESEFKNFVKNSFIITTHETWDLLYPYTFVLVPTTHLSLKPCRWFVKRYTEDSNGLAFVPGAFFTYLFICCKLSTDHFILWHLSQASTPIIYTLPSSTKLQFQDHLRKKGLHSCYNNCNSWSDLQNSVCIVIFQIHVWFS
jgi:hypothetical protein